jgi:hypothetical protein
MEYALRENLSSSTLELGVLLDQKLTGKDHLQGAAEKGKSRLRLLQRAAGVCWGTSVSTLTLTYKTYIRPVIEYGTEIFITASEQDFSAVCKVQNQALRNCSGAIKTTPIP